MNREIVRLHNQGRGAKAIADTLGIPLARVWRVIARAYERAYRDGLATVGQADERVAKIDGAARGMAAEVERLRAQLAEVRAYQNLPDSRWRARASAIAKETSALRRLALLSLPLDQELPPAAVIDLRTRKEAEA